MATITLDPTHVTIAFSCRERIAGILRDVRIPRSAVRAARTSTTPLREPQGVRAPGTGLWRRAKIGTWRAPGLRQLVCVQAGQTAVVIDVDGTRHHRYIVSTTADEAERIVAALRADPAGDLA